MRPSNLEMAIYVLISALLQLIWAPLYVSIMYTYIHTL